MIKIIKIFSLILIIIVSRSALCQTNDPEIKIHYLGHSSFILSFNNGMNIVTDYGKKNAWVEWGWDSPILDIVELIPDVMTFSHEHDDHYDPLRIPKGVKYILKDLDSLSINGIEITPIRTCESDINDESNTSYIFEYNGLKICHLGDAQADIININNPIVKEKVLNNFPQNLDLLLMTIDWTEHFTSQVADFIEALNPKIVIPMHYWSEEYLQEFLKYLNDQNNLQNNYNIEERNNAKYNICLDLAEKVFSTNIIVLKREPYYK